MRAGDAPLSEPALETEGVLGTATLTRRLKVIAGGLALLLAGLVVNLTYIQVIDAPALAAHPANTRALAREIRQERGAVLTSDGVVLARSVPQGDLFSREYPAGTLAAHVIGYYSPQLGRAGVEAALDRELAGERSFESFADAVDAAAGLPVTGNDVVLTIDSRVQAAAEAQLQGRRGSIVAIDPATGAVLAMASSPTFEPATVEDQWQALSTESMPAPLVNRAVDSLYPPGSTFKIVTLTGALADGVVTPSTAYSGRSPIEIGGADVTNYGGGSYGATTVREATRRSINTVYAQVAVDLGAEGLVSQAESFGFSQEPPIEIPAEASWMSRPDLMTTWELAWAGVGQPVGEHEGPIGPSVTPLQMALVAAGLGNDGVVMRPHLVERVVGHAGQTLTSTTPEEWTRAVDAETAGIVRDIMVEVVRSGTGTRASIPGVSVAGKTGSAEVGKDVQTHAWFICFAPAEDPVIAVAVVLEEAGTGGRNAAPAAKVVLETALGSTGDGS
jgi:peptidoglycan glycosyltransferase